LKFCSFNDNSFSHVPGCFPSIRFVLSEPHFRPAPGAGQEPFITDQTSQTAVSSFVQRVSPKKSWRDASLKGPGFGDMLDRHSQGDFDLVARRASISGLRLKAVDCPTHKFMHQLPESERAERQGLLRQFDGAPAKSVLPDESERVAQQSLERCRGMDARQRAFNGRMFRSDRTIMRGEFSPRTTSPAGSAG
jgi:hypothetical protein